MVLPDKLYTVLKWIDLIFFPAIITLYSALSSIWNWPFSSEIVATGTAIELFIGAIIGVSAITRNKLQDVASIEEKNNYIPKYGDNSDIKNKKS